MGSRLAVVMMVWLLASTVQAGDFRTPISIDIPAQTLSGALTALANQADLQILFPQELVTGLQAPAISGSYSAAEVLERLLAGAELEFVMSGRDTVVIRSHRRSPSSPQNSTLNVPPTYRSASFGRHANTS